MAHFDLAPLRPDDETLPVDAVIIYMVTAEVPSHPISFDRSWKHIFDIRLLDPDFGTPRDIDVLLDADIFSHSMHHGCRVSLPSSPSAFKTFRLGLKRFGPCSMTPTVGYYLLYLISLWE